MNIIINRTDLLIESEFAHHLSNGIGHPSLFCESVQTSIRNTNCFIFILYVILVYGFVFFLPFYLALHTYNIYCYLYYIRMLVYMYVCTLFSIILVLVIVYMSTLVFYVFFSFFVHTLIVLLSYTYILLTLQSFAAIVFSLFVLWNQVFFS